MLSEEDIDDVMNVVTLVKLRMTMIAVTARQRRAWGLRRQQSDKPGIRVRLVLCDGAVVVG